MIRSANALRVSPQLLVITLICSTSYTLGLVNVAPITRPTAPWVVRGRGRRNPLFNAPEATTSDASLPTAQDTPPDVSEESSINEVASASALGVDTTEQTTQTQTAATQTSPPQRKGVWKPPSQNLEQLRGKIFSIQQPQDLLDFVIEDERLSVGELFIYIQVVSAICSRAAQFVRVTHIYVLLFLNALFQFTHNKNYPFSQSLR